MKKILLSASLFTSLLCFSQINYSEGFEAAGNPTGWIFTSFSSQTSSSYNICEGTKVRGVSFSTLIKTANMVYTSTATSNGNAIDISYQFSPKANTLSASYTTKGNVKLEYAIGSSTTYTQLAAATFTTESACAKLSGTIPAGTVAKGSTIKVRITGNADAGSSNLFYLSVDDFQIVQSTTLATNDSAKTEKKYIQNTNISDKILLSNIDEISEIRIYSTYGNLLKKINTIENEINISNLSKGIYFVKTELKSGKMVSNKILKN